MRSATHFVLASISMLTISIGLPASLSADAALEAAADRVTVEDTSVRDHAIASLRAAGQAGVDTLQARAATIPSTDRHTFLRALDAVCAQRDCAWSGLFWHTDLGAARAEAHERNRPILSLRLLGRLDQERSCANSRFFRTVLYADPEVADLLRNRYVLHWSSERPVPAIRIDFGDGRKLEGTITGNSAHHVLDAQGRVLDALPGLYGAGLFMARLAAIADLAAELRGASDEGFAVGRAAYHNARARELSTELTAFLERKDWVRDIEAASRRAMEDLELLASLSDRRNRLRRAGRDASGVPPAGTASRRAQAKSVTETPVLSAMTWHAPAGTIGDALWQNIASRHRAAWRLSAASQSFLKEKHGADDPWFVADLSRFEEGLGIDTMRNEYMLHLEIHHWLATESGVGPSFESFNASVYSELFLTPASDPWLGLRSADTYLALGDALEIPPASPR